MGRCGTVQFGERASRTGNLLSKSDWLIPAFETLAVSSLKPAQESSGHICHSWLSDSFDSEYKPSDLARLIDAV